jgi:hypothetical protein
MAGSGPQPVTVAARRAAPVGVVSSSGRSGDDGGRRVREQPVGGPDHAGAGGHGAGLHLVDAEHLQRGGRADDVDDGVEAAHLVEVDLLGRTAVQPALDLGQRGEGGEGPGRHPFRQTGLGDQAGDVGRGANDAGLLGPDVGLGGGDAAPEHRLDLQLPALDRELAEQAADLVRVGAGVDERAQRHVAGDPREAVEPGDRPGGHFSILSTALAAPNPLSMPTTVRPAAHEASMASRAVTPSSAAP